MGGRSKDSRGGVAWGFEEGFGSVLVCCFCPLPALSRCEVSLGMVSLPLGGRLCGAAALVGPGLSKPPGVDPLRDQRSRLADAVLGRLWFWFGCSADTLCQGVNAPPVHHLQRGLRGGRGTAALVPGVFNYQQKVTQFK